MSDLALVVMAAGIGSRYGGMKQIEPIGPGGEIILDYSVYDAMESGFGEIIFVINREIERSFRERIDQSIGKHCKAIYVFQDLKDLPKGFEVPEGRVKPWGTAHAVLSCRDVVQGAFAVINADDFYGRSAYQSLADFMRDADVKTDGNKYCLVGYQLENTLTDHGSVARGICKVDNNGYLIEVRERTKIQERGGKIQFCTEDETWVEISADTIASMNLWGFSPTIFEELDLSFKKFLVEHKKDLVKPEYFLPEVVTDLLHEKKATVKVLPTLERWFGITYRQDVNALKRKIVEKVDKGVYPKKLWG